MNDPSTHVLLIEDNPGDADLVRLRLVEGNPGGCDLREPAGGRFGFAEARIAVSGVAGLESSR